jgi:hypothetical protein
MRLRRQLLMRVRLLKETYANDLKKLFEVYKKAHPRK